MTVVVSETEKIIAGDRVYCTNVGLMTPPVSEERAEFFNLDEVRHLYWKVLSHDLTDEQIKETYKPNAEKVTVVKA